MSRTYRLLSTTPKTYKLRNWLLYSSKKPIDPFSKEAKKRIALHFSDKKANHLNWKGPGEFHNLTAQRPHRRHASSEINKFMKDNEYEVLILSKPKRHWWL